MTHNLLLPNRYKTIGWFILIPTAILGVILIAGNSDLLEYYVKVPALWSEKLLEGSRFFSLYKTDIIKNTTGVLFIVGSLLVGFSKERHEDEYIANLRHNSLLWAVLVNSLMLLFAFIFVHGMAFLNVMMYNIFTVLIIFIGRFNYLLYKNAKSISDEK